MNILRHSILVVTIISSVSSFSQETVRSSSSLYLPAYKKADVTVPYAISAEGKRFSPDWGLDQAWISESNVLKGINHMGKENITFGRTAFRYSQALTNDTLLGNSDINAMKERNKWFDKVSTSLPLVFTADQEAVNPETTDGPPEYFVKNKSANVDHWAAMINSHVHWMQANTNHPIIGISPFNEGDYWSVEEGATADKQHQVAKLLKEKYPRCAGIAMVGGNTLNNNKALSWYTDGKAYYDWGNTHQLAGSFDTFAGFYEQLANDGKVGYADEMHNVGEAMIGLEYGMTKGIWWGFDSRARGEFCQITRHGVRLAYAENRSKWTAASVYRHDDGRVKAFVGSSERQANTTTYQFVSTERDVYYDGYGPVHEFVMELQSGDAGTYQTEKHTNGERVIDVTWGEDVPPSVINGTYKIINKASGANGNVVAYGASGSNINQQIYKESGKQQWTVKPCSPRVGGDYSFYDIESVDNPNIRMNVKNYSKSTADIIAYTQNKPSSNEQWYLEYAGDGYYYIRNRESALYLASYSTSPIAKIIQTSKLSGSERDRMMFRFVPVDVTFDTQAPAQPVGLVAEQHPASVRLSWTANTETDVEGYMVVRAPKGTDDWNTIARKLTTTYFVDNTCKQGTSYIYKVKAIDQSQNLSQPSEPVEAAPTGERSRIAHWHFDDNLYDMTDNMMDCALYGTANYTSIHMSGEKALQLKSTNYLQLPYKVANSDELTVSMWVYWTTSANWQRLFDFGNGTDQYLFLTPSNGNGVMRFAIKNGGDEQVVDCDAKLTMNRWKYVTLTIGKDETIIYIDGEEAASSTGITIRPSDIHPVMNYIGRSQFTSDTNFMGYVDDVRIYNYALTAEEVRADMADTSSAIRDLPVDNDNLPTAVYSIDGKRLPAVRSGLNIVDGKKVIVNH